MHRFVCDECKHLPYKEGPVKFWRLFCKRKFGAECLWPLWFDDPTHYFLRSIDISDNLSLHVYIRKKTLHSLEGYLSQSDTILPHELVLSTHIPLCQNTSSIASQHSNIHIPYIMGPADNKHAHFIAHHSFNFPFIHSLSISQEMHTSSMTVVSSSTSPLSVCN